MSWFGGRGSSQREDVTSEKTDLPAYDEGPGEFASAPGGVAPSSAAGSEAVQMALLQEQQKALVQQVIAKLTEVSFDQCIERPEPSLTSRQRSCVHTVVGKYLDTSEFVIGRATKQR